MSAFRTEYKGYYVQPHSLHPSCYVIVTSGRGGKIPDTLSGMYTTRTLAMFDIDAYVESKPTKGKVNDEAIDTGGSK